MSRKRGAISRARISSSERYKAVQRCMVGLLEGAPIQPRRVECCVRARVGNALPRGLVPETLEAGEFAPAACDHFLRQLAVEITEERKRLLRAPFLAHEQ